MGEWEEVLANVDKAIETLCKIRAREYGTQGLLGKTDTLDTLIRLALVRSRICERVTRKCERT